MERENKPETDREEKKEDGACTPPAPNQFELEQEWADRLGMDFDPDRASVPSPVPEPEKEAERQPPMYVMPADEYPPRPQYEPQSPLPEGSERLQRPEPMPPTYMLWAVLSTICCCLPAGIVAIVFASSVSSKYYARDYAGARKASRNAEIWIIVSIVAGVLANALYMPLTLLMPN